MLLVKTKIGPSKIEGTGLFADEDIPKDTVIWEFNPLLDRIYTEEEYELLPPLAREYADKYSFYDKGKYILCGDHAIFTNHSETEQNIGSTDEVSFALRDIKKGEEIVDNYDDYDEDPHDKVINFETK